MEPVIMNEIKKIAGTLSGIHTERIVLREPFIDFAARFAPRPGTVILMSGGNLDCARYHILGAKPWLTFSGRRHNTYIATENRTFAMKADPFDTLREILHAFQTISPDLQVPAAAGLFGYLAYDLKDSLERLPRTSVDNLNLPHICLFAPSIIVIHDKLNDSTGLYIPKRILSGQSNFDNDYIFFQKALASKPLKPVSFHGDTGGFKSNFKKPDYRDAIEKIKEYIAYGHVYQVNMSQQFEMDFYGDTFTLFKTLYQKNPAPFFAYVNAGDHQIVSTSPERFILRAGNRVETRPIKGTRPRGKTPEEDLKHKTELKQSHKDDAELSMIVDLLRNDLGKVCKAGSVYVADHKRLEEYENVYHLVSVVEGTLDRGRDSVDLLKAVFPGGSITGCPKIRAMEIIDELEPHRRHIYTGSLGYLSFHDTLDLSIAIRTATIYNKKIIFSAGGGIVFDSDPFDEYNETMHKSQTLMEVFQGIEKITINKTWAWINGALQPLSQASVKIVDYGFQFGYGFFETIRVDQGKTGYLKEHLDRFYQTWNHLFFKDTPDVTWDEIINQVITKNDLAHQTAAVKIIAAMGDREEPPFTYTLIVIARPYTHRLAEKKEPGLNLAIYPEPRLTPLADYKTLNYLYYLLAGKWAKDKGADEALIINPDGTVSETNTANILMIKDKTVVVPDSPHVLPGIMQNVVCTLLVKWGYTIEKKKVQPKDISAYDQIFITNSLMGAVPVITINGEKLKKPSRLWQEINNKVL